MDCVSKLEYRHVDVFADQKMTGNGLTVFIDEQHNLDTTLMQNITQEMRQFESIFLKKTGAPYSFLAHIFTMEEELDFAGHPLLGAAAVLHEKYSNKEKETWQFQLKKKTVTVISEKIASAFHCSMNQGPPSFLKIVNDQDILSFLSSLNIKDENLSKQFPLQVVSTGLPYLIIPIERGIEEIRVQTTQIEDMLRKIGAKFSYVIDIHSLEGRSWDNNGIWEDIATGSAAGPVGAYLYQYNRDTIGQKIILKQGRFMNRESKIHIELEIKNSSISNIIVSGKIQMIAKGIFD